MEVSRKRRKDIQHVVPGEQNQGSVDATILFPFTLVSLTDADGTETMAWTFCPCPVGSIVLFDYLVKCAKLLLHNDNLSRDPRKGGDQHHRRIASLCQVTA